MPKDKRSFYKEALTNSYYSNIDGVHQDLVASIIMESIAKMNQSTLSQRGIQDAIKPEVIANPVSEVETIPLVEHDATATEPPVPVTEEPLPPAPVTGEPLPPVPVTEEPLLPVPVTEEPLPPVGDSALQETTPREVTTPMVEHTGATPTEMPGPATEEPLPHVASSDHQEMIIVGDVTMPMVKDYVNGILLAAIEIVRNDPPPMTTEPVPPVSTENTTPSVDVPPPPTADNPHVVMETNPLPTAHPNTPPAAENILAATAGNPPRATKTFMERYSKSLHSLGIWAGISLIWMVSILACCILTEGYLGFFPDVPDGTTPLTPELEPETESLTPHEDYTPALITTICMVTVACVGGFLFWKKRAMVQSRVLRLLAFGSFALVTSAVGVVTYAQIITNNEQSTPIVLVEEISTEEEEITKYADTLSYVCIAGVVTCLIGSFIKSTLLKDYEFKSILITHIEKINRCLTYIKTVMNKYNTLVGSFINSKLNDYNLGSYLKTVITSISHSYVQAVIKKYNDGSFLKTFKIKNVFKNYQTVGSKLKVITLLGMAALIITTIVSCWYFDVFGDFSSFESLTEKNRPLTPSSSSLSYLNLEWFSTTETEEQSYFGWDSMILSLFKSTPPPPKSILTKFMEFFRPEERPQSLTPFW
ncbi:uncharacterized protein [Clytia hemisphaerica]|uniref:uncharacterized protein n=1 Tax=Clytia hemisphaerica TaxID=252671 RepID=UPI0034D4FAF4